MTTSAAVKYIGPFDAVEIDGVGEVKNGQTVEVDADLAKSLLKQDTNWTSGKKSDANENKES